MANPLGLARIVERGGELLGQANALVKLAQRQQPGVTAELLVGRLHHHDGQTTRESERLLPSRLDTHDWPRAGVEVF
jgi:hypothetical protein